MFLFAVGQSVFSIPKRTLTNVLIHQCAGPVSRKLQPDNLSVQKVHVLSQDKSARARARARGDACVFHSCLFCVALIDLQSSGSRICTLTFRERCGL